MRWLDYLAIDPLTRQRHNRKVWEWCFLLSSMHSLGLLEIGRSAVGFGVGRERLPAILAAHGVLVLATDQAADTAGAWATTDQHAAVLDELRYDDVCSPAEFERLVSFRSYDMNDRDRPLGRFDVCWSSCAFEHLGSPQHGLDFVADSARHLAPRGWALHTTEVRVDGGPDLDLGGTVLYAVETIERLVASLVEDGWWVEADFTVPAAHAHDRYVDRPPYRFQPAHMRMEMAGAVSSSFGLVLQAPSI